jgi:hypothetical protein
MIMSMKFDASKHDELRKEVQGLWIGKAILILLIDGCDNQDLGAILGMTEEAVIKRRKEIAGHMWDFMIKNPL